MKPYSFLILIFFVSSVFCENGGVKIAINQGLIDSMLDFFFKNLTQLLKKILLKTQECYMIWYGE